MTSSARSSSDGGIVRPSALADLRLTTSVLSHKFGTHLSSERIAFEGPAKGPGGLIPLACETENAASHLAVAHGAHHFGAMILGRWPYDLRVPSPLPVDMSRRSEAEPR